MDELTFTELIRAARKMVCAPGGGTQECRDSANAFLKRLFDDYGHGEEHAALEPPEEEGPPDYAP